MNPVVVTLWNSEDDELQIGPFSQGVVFEADDERIAVIDVATRKEIAEAPYMNPGWPMSWRRIGPTHRVIKRYSSIFIHAADDKKP